jgi:hypothetical protein
VVCLLVWRAFQRQQADPALAGETASLE